MNEIDAINIKLSKLRSQLEVMDIEYKSINEEILKLENDLEFLKFAKDGKDGEG